MFIHAHDVDAVGITVDDAEHGDKRSQAVDEVQELESCEVRVPFALEIGKLSRPFTFAICNKRPLTVTMIPWPWTQFLQYWEAAKVRNVAYGQVSKVWYMMVPRAIMPRASFSTTRIHFVLAKSTWRMVPVGGMRSMLSWSDEQETVEPSAMMSLRGPAMRPLEAAT